MVKRALQITLLGVVFFSFPELGCAKPGDLHLDVFTGCMQEGPDKQDRCSAVCGAHYKTVGGIGFAEDPRRCSPERPIACFCDYREV